ncbi:chloroplastic lipocalin isoform X2 [Malania oleifera]|uniref:chloroplastic lipocalin isoform X2 n=1 Tax=Malania oleifera TaxID=397392 RepID=UPI0025ADF6D5|nr:chloroplastic lipocalin isoform X2 [Malania oleifera]
MILVQAHPFLFQPSLSPVLPRGCPGISALRCSAEHPTSSKAVVRCLLSGLTASCIFLSQSNQVVLADKIDHHNLYLLASATNNKVTLPLDEKSDEKSGMLMMMRGMTAKNFDPIRYSGRWFEVASLKRGFAGQGQQDCHCTQGVYTFDMAAPSIQVDTFCVHGGPDGYITGIRGNVQCLSEQDLDKNETDLEKQEMIKEKCFLRFPTLPFIPKEPYDVIATDYDSFSLVSGAKDRSFIQDNKIKPVQQKLQILAFLLATSNSNSYNNRDLQQQLIVLATANYNAKRTLNHSLHLNEESTLTNTIALLYMVSLSRHQIIL